MLKHRSFLKWKRHYQDFKPAQYIELLGQKNGTAKLPAFIAMDW